MPSSSRGVPFRPGEGPEGSSASQKEGRGGVSSFSLSASWGSTGPGPVGPCGRVRAGVGTCRGGCLAGPVGLPVGVGLCLGPWTLLWEGAVARASLVTTGPRGLSGPCAGFIVPSIPGAVWLCAPTRPCGRRTVSVGWSPQGASAGIRAQAHKLGSEVSLQQGPDVGVCLGTTAGGRSPFMAEGRGQSWLGSGVCLCWHRGLGRP